MKTFKPLLYLAVVVLLIIYLFPFAKSFAACPAGTARRIGVENGLLTTTKDFTTATSKFSTSGPCIIDSPATIPQFAVPTYAEMKSIYYDQAKPSSTTSRKALDITDIDNQTTFNGILETGKTAYLLHRAGDLSITSNISGNNNLVIFVDGNLLIKTGTNTFTYGDSNSGVIFIVQGNVYTDQAMGGGSNSINGYFIVSGQFCSASSGSDPASATCVSNIDKTLTINGSIIALATESTNKPNFGRINSADSNPSETINYQAKYLVILSNIFSKNLSIWRELQ